MALIKHTCTKCSHPDYWRRANVSDDTSKPCTCGCKCAPAKPEVAPTWNDAGQLVERIAKPGSKLTAEDGKGGFAIVTCNCGDCKALYAQLTA